MGKRKSSKPPPKARAEPLATTFKCVFCHREKAVSVKMDKQEMYGHLTCKECGQRYSSPINNLSAAVDVYCDWKDACEEIRLKQPAKTRPTRPPNPIAHGAAGGAAFNAGGRAFEKDADADVDAEGEDSDGGARKVGYLDDEDEEGEEEDEAEREAGEKAREGKKRRVVVDSDEDED